jgi:UDP-N-acetylmuramoylalanine--D-glutamate ligase
VAILTNITPDHLDRYNNDFSQYIQSKINLFNNMDRDDDVIYYGEDKHVRKALDGLVKDFRRHEISLIKLNSGGAYFDQSHIILDTKSGEFRVPLNDISLKGDHNMINVMCATSAALLAGAKEEHLREGLKNFKNAAHRMEKVEDLEGVVFVNDSKGTNVDATAYALASFKEPLIWIAGGVDKGNDYSQLLPWVKNHVKLLICLGKNNEKLKRAFADQVDEITETQDIREGVQLAYSKSVMGDVVLLSPACASFDLFKNYEDRGDQFKSAVRELKTKGK